VVCKQYGIPYCTHSLNIPCPYIKYRPEDGSLEPKHVASYVLLTLNIPSLACQRCLPSWGPRRNPWVFFFVIS